MATTYETLLTPATCVASDDDLYKSQGDVRQSPRWKSGLGKRSSGKTDLTSGTAPRDVGKGGPADPADTKKKKAKSSNVVKRAIHKIKKKKSTTHSSSSSQAPPSSGGDIDKTPPKIEDLGIDPRLLEKWMARKELKKQGAVAGEQQPGSRHAATLVVVGLSSGSVAWAKERIRSLSEAHGLALATCLVIAAVAIACTLVLTRCS
ncbi:unnamed protein product [Scytosiphon promiscuus]